MALDATLQRSADQTVYTHMAIGLAVVIEMLILDFVRLPNPVYALPLVANTLLVVFLGLRVRWSYRNMRQAPNPTLFATYQIAGGIAFSCALLSCIIVAVLAYSLPAIMSRF